MLGGGQRLRVPAYASLLKYGDPDVCARLTNEALSAGYKLIKLHEKTVPPVAATRAVAGADIPIMLDVNCAWSPHEAGEMAKKLTPYNLHWLEEPLWPPENFEALSELRSVHGIPIASGENACTVWQFDQMFKVGAVDYAQASMTKVGGITEMQKIAALAEVENINLQPHSPYFGPGFLATLHLLAASPNIESIERFYVTLEADMYGNALDPVDGFVHVPDGPGLGLDPDPAFINKYRTD
jgi:L-alanine-DL-glutamate epimerase-like enolase superfamily enzyme